MRKSSHKFGRIRLPPKTQFPKAKDVEQKAKYFGLDGGEENTPSSPALTAWYVSEFCRANYLKE